jgi:uncharacterized protein YeeX (DUF496 family)
MLYQPLKLYFHLQLIQINGNFQQKFKQNFQDQDLVIRNHQKRTLLIYHLKNQWEEIFRRQQF